MRMRDVLRCLVTLNPLGRFKTSTQISHADLLQSMRHKYAANLNPPLSDQEMVRRYSQSTIVLGFLEVFDNHDHSKQSLQHLHLREFEVPMTGALYMTNYSDELAEFYEIDKEVVVFRNEHELLNKVKYYLYHPDEAEKIRRAGYERSMACHSYHKRYDELFHKLNIKH